MKKLIMILAILLVPTLSFAWVLSWNDTIGEDGYIISYKDYPTGYSFPANPAPESAIKDMSGVIQVTVPVDTVKWPLPNGFVEGNRYVFFIQATKEGSVSGYSDYVCWPYPMPAKVIELPDQSGGDIQINIYQVPR